MRYLITIFILILVFPAMTAQKNNKVKIGMLTDAHIPTMHDSEYRITTFIEEMKAEKPDFIIELGDFATPEKEYSHIFGIWNSFPGKNFHVIGNHEMDGGFTLDQALRNLNLTKSYYSFDMNGFHFIVLDGNDKNVPESKGYKQYIGNGQVKWLRDDLASCIYPVVVFSHQGLSFYHGPDEDYGVENYDEIQKIFERHNADNPGRKVIACFNGHSHADKLDEINGIYYITITSMSYHWLGEKYVCVRYSEEVDRNFKWIKYTAPFKEPLFTVVEISDSGFIKIKGKSTEWEGPSPFDLGYPAEYKQFIKPSITGRKLKFNLQ